MRQVQSRFRRRRGKIIVLAAFFMVVMLAFLALSVDVGYIYTVKTRLQAAADAAACAGAIALADGADDAVTPAIDFAELNQAYPGEFTMAAADVELGVWNEDTASFAALSDAGEDEPNAVRVFCRRTQSRGNEVGLFFAKILGNDYADIVATATARYKTAKCGMIVGVNFVGLSGSTYVNSYKSADGPYSPVTAGTNGNVCSNGNIMLSQMAAIDGDAHPGMTGQFLDYSTGDASGSTAPLTEDLSFPAVDTSEAAVSNDNATIEAATNGVIPVNGDGALVLVGPYHVDLLPGTYYFTSIMLAGGATVGVSGETIIFVDGDILLSGASVMNSTMDPQDLQFYSTGANISMSGSAAFYGVLYAPTARIMWSGTSDFYGSAIGSQLLLSGYGGVHADDSLELKILETGVKRTALVD